MSSVSFRQALNLALELSTAERASLAYDLLASLDSPADADAAQAWEAEVARRLEELERGGAQMVDADEALSRIDARLGRRR
jgi:putative addiction module component (TIGR02574 family)